MFRGYAFFLYKSLNFVSNMAVFSQISISLGLANAYSKSWKVKKEQYLADCQSSKNKHKTVYWSFCSDLILLHETELIVYVLNLPSS